VSQLFADHPDLLMEFTYFLPDAVQEQVRQPLCDTVLPSTALQRTCICGLFPFSACHTTCCSFVFTRGL
jgi:histone deacetylase complex regulatory component SIN3